MILNETLEFIKEKNLINKNDKILVAFSGGADSLALILILDELKKELSIDLGAVHINHLLRGENSFLDEDYVSEICKDMGIELFIKREDINLYASRKNISIEEAGREIRYDYFREVMDHNGYNKCALAHNLNDVSETVLLNLFRGTGLKGLVGIPVERGPFIRPIMFLTRDRIESYNLSKGKKGQIDSSNILDIYGRNKIRNNIIPYVEENFNKDFVNTISRMVSLIENDLSFIEDKVSFYQKKYVIEKANQIEIKKDFLILHDAIRTRLIIESIGMLKGNKINIEKIHIDNVILLSNSSHGSQIELKDDIIVINDYDSIIIKYKEDSENNLKVTESKDFLILEKKNSMYSFKSKNIKINKISKNEEMDIKFKKGSFYLDLDKIEGDIRVSLRSPGDKIKPFGMRGYKKINRVFIDEKISRYKRDDILIFKDNKTEDIMYIENLIISEDYKIDKQTKNILSIKISGEEIND